MSKNYKISRFEETSDSLFICINSTTTPIYIEHFFTEEERADEVSIKSTIERLVAELEVKTAEYVEPEQPVSRLDLIDNLVLDEKNINKAKAEIISKKSEDSKNG